jgi:hypothetical protein
MVCIVPVVYRLKNIALTWHQSYVNSYTFKNPLDLNVAHYLDLEYRLMFMKCNVALQLLTEATVKYGALFRSRIT